MQKQCPNMSINYDQSENEMLHYLSSPLLPLSESSSRTLQVHDIQDDLASVRRRNHEIADTPGTTTFHKSNTNKESQQYIFQ
jgi:hypothetical protein